MEMLAESEDNCVQGFLAAGHVCTVAGYASYEL
jgi:hydrogenase expression/formation protein HypD